MRYDPNKRRVPAHLYFSRLISQRAQMEQEWIIVMRDYLVAIGNLVEEIAIASNIDFEIVPLWAGNTITLAHTHHHRDSTADVLKALQMLDAYCNQQLRYELKRPDTWTALAHLPANLGNNAFYIDVFDPSMQLGEVIAANHPPITPESSQCVA